MQKNENRLGYKKTRIGWLPEDWEICKASEVMDVRDGTHDTPKKKEAGVLLITSKNIIHGRLNTSDCYYISEQDASLINRRSKVAQGDILMSMIGTVGESALIEGIPNFCIKNVGLFKRNESRIASRYLIKYFYSNLSRRAVRKASNGGIQKFISLAGLRQLFILLPPLPEQEAIAGVLECWDKAIRNYEKKIERKRNIKKGLMQRLLSGKQRLPEFEGEWKEVRLGEVGNVITGNTPPKKYPSNYGDKYCWATAEDFIDKYIIDTCLKLSEQGQDQARILPQGSVLVTCIASIGLNAISGVPLATNQQINAIIVDDENYSNEFVYYLISKNKLLLQRFAGSGAVSILSKSEFEKMKMTFPSLSEQTAIASILSAADSEIEAMERKLANLKDQKKFLLNNLVTGTIRLPKFRGRAKNTDTNGDHT